MKKVIRLTESDLVKLVKKVIKEQDLIGMANQILSGSGDSDTKVLEFCNICKKSNLIFYKDTGRVNQFADQIRDAVQGVGTNEESIYKVFEDLESFDEFCGMVMAYEDSYNVDLYTDLSDDISDESEWVRIMRPLRNLVHNIQPSDKVRPPLTPLEKAEQERHAQAQQDRMGKGKIPSTTPTSSSGITYDNKTKTYRRPDGR